jgi:hypothetical protein
MSNVLPIFPEKLTEKHMKELKEIVKDLVDLKRERPDLFETDESKDVFGFYKKNPYHCGKG